MNDNKNEWTSEETAADVAIRHLVENSDLSPLQAKELVAKHGTDIDALMEIARTFKAEG